MNKWGRNSLAVRRTLHPLLRLVMDRALEECDISLVCGLRGEQEQNEAWKTKRSKVRFPNSRHNKTSDPDWGFGPVSLVSDAVDCVPAAVGYKATDEQLRTMARFILAAGSELGIALRWGGDFRMDGDKTTDDSWDKYHFELVFPPRK